MPTGNLGFFTMDAQGRITYTFAGRILADGVDFKTVPAASFDPANTSQIRWFRDNDNLIAGYLYELRSGTFHVIGLQARTSNLLALEGAAFVLQSDSASDAGNVAIVTASGTGGTPATQRSLLRADGTSQFMQSATPKESQTLYGPYNSTDSGVIAPDASANVTVTHNLNLTAGQQADLIFAAHIVDNSFGNRFSWALQSQTANVVTYGMRNNGPGNAQASLRGYLIIPAT